jgi:hypothetical protein
MNDIMIIPTNGKSFESMYSYKELKEKSHIKDDPLGLIDEEGE